MENANEIRLLGANDHVEFERADREGNDTLKKFFLPSCGKGLINILATAVVPVKIHRTTNRGQGGKYQYINPGESSGKNVIELVVYILDHKLTRKHACHARNRKQSRESFARRLSEAVDGYPGQLVGKRVWVERDLNKLYTVDVKEEIQDFEPLTEQEVRDLLDSFILPAEAHAEVTHDSTNDVEVE